MSYATTKLLVLAKKFEAQLLRYKYAQAPFQHVTPGSPGEYSEEWDFAGMPKAKEPSKETKPGNRLSDSTQNLPKTVPSRSLDITSNLNTFFQDLVSKGIFSSYSISNDAYRTYWVYAIVPLAPGETFTNSDWVESEMAMYPDKMDRVPKTKMLVDKALGALNPLTTLKAEWGNTASAIRVFLKSPRRGPGPQDHPYILFLQKVL